MTPHFNTGRQHTAEHRQKNSDARKRAGTIPPSRRGIKHTEATRRQLSESHRGEKHWNWSGGVPDCLDCGKALTSKTSKRCFGCRVIWQRGPNSPTWKNGVSQHPGYKNTIKRKSRLGTCGSHTGTEWQYLKEKYNFMCLCCKQQEPFIKLSEDHIIPLSVGGTDYISNIQPLCQSCNSRKHTRIIDYRPLAVTQ